ncbi:hypothetical protein ACQPZQ_03330 [Pseudonocardia sp. CA-142604]|uniref:hypothetical protein n=1 Tax=Pseudonocardia sp. CA-142604 TaxID=3240024 RepID=UPI003D94C82B
MSTVRKPVIVGLAAGDGATTLAAALHAHDGGRLEARAARGADIVVCRRASLRQAATLVCAPARPRPILAVTLGPGDEPEPADGLHHPLHQRFETVVALPHVAEWHHLTKTHYDAAAVLAQPPEQLTSPLREHAAALRALVAALVGSGLLARPVPPLLARPSTDLPRAIPVPVMRPVDRATQFQPVLIAAPRPVVPVPVSRLEPDLEPDDEALEAEAIGEAVAVGRAG